MKFSGRYGVWLGRTCNLPAHPWLFLSTAYLWVVPLQFSVKSVTAQVCGQQNSGRHLTEHVLSRPQLHSGAVLQECRNGN